MEELKKKPGTPKEMLQKGFIFLFLGLFAITTIIGWWIGIIFAIFGVFGIIQGAVFGFMFGWNTPLKEINERIKRYAEKKKAERAAKKNLLDNVQK